MQKIRIKWILSLQKEMQIRTWFTLIEKKLSSKFKVQNQIMWSVHK